MKINDSTKAISIFFAFFFITVGIMFVVLNFILPVSDFFITAGIAFITKGVVFMGLAINRNVNNHDHTELVDKINHVETRLNSMERLIKYEYTKRKEKKQNDNRKSKIIV